LAPTNSPSARIQACGVVDDLDRPQPGTPPAMGLIRADAPHARLVRVVHCLRECEYGALHRDRPVRHPNRSVSTRSGVAARGSVGGARVCTRRIYRYVRIRNWKPGDYYRPVGWPAGKLKKLFQRARIPRSQRTSWPVVVAESTIVWVASFPVSREFAARECSQKIVAFEVQL
jgi:tRNA(Ile)-lysidine synthetase-like protein